MLSPEGPMSLPRARLAALDFQVVVDYLKERGWIESDHYFTGVSVAFRIFKPGRRQYEVLVPHKPISENHISWMNDAVIEIARYEGRKGWEVLDDLEKREDT